MSTEIVKGLLYPKENKLSPPDIPRKQTWPEHPRHPALWGRFESAWWGLEFGIILHLKRQILQGPKKIFVFWYRD